MKKKIIIFILIIVIILAGILVFKNFWGTKENFYKENILVVGIDDSYPPMVFRNENNEIVGVDVDIAKAVCEKLGMDIKFQSISWASKEQELDSGNIDCIWSGFGYTEDRAKTMALSDTYIQGEMFFILKDGSEIKSQDELKGKKIGVQSGSIQEADLAASDFGKEVEMIPFSDFVTAFTDLGVGGIDALYISNTIGNYLINSRQEKYITIPSEVVSKSEGIVVGLKKDNVELRDKINSALKELESEGRLKEISEKWFGTDMINLEER